MFLRSWQRCTQVGVIGVVLVGSLLSGCSVEVRPGPGLSSAAEEAKGIGEGIKQLGEGAINGLKEQLSGVVDFNLPLEEQLRQLETGANQKYCELKGTPLGKFVRDVANEVRETIVVNNPGVDVRPLNISDQC